MGAERREVDLAVGARNDGTSLRAAPTPALARLLRSRGREHAASLAVLAFALVLLAGCGFQPLYGARGGVASESVEAMAATRIALIPDRAGQILRNNLLDRLTPRGSPAAPRYELAVSLSERVDRLGIALDDSATYGRLTVVARFALRDVAGGQPVLAGQSRWTNGFTIVASHFGNLTSEADARNRALLEISEDIRLQLGLHFAKPG